MFPTCRVLGWHIFGGAHSIGRRFTTPPSPQNLPPSICLGRCDAGETPVLFFGGGGCCLVVRLCCRGRRHVFLILETLMDPQIAFHGDAEVIPLCCSTGFRVVWAITWDPIYLTGWRLATTIILQFVVYSWGVGRDPSTNTFNCETMHLLIESELLQSVWSPLDVFDVFNVFISRDILFSSDKPRQYS